MMTELFSMWSAGNTTCGLACAAAVLWRLWHLWNAQMETREQLLMRRLMLTSVVAMVAGIFWHQSGAWYSWETGAWVSAMALSGHSVPYRALWSAGMFGASVAVLFPKLRIKSLIVMPGIFFAGAFVAWLI